MGKKQKSKKQLQQTDRNILYKDNTVTQLVDDYKKYIEENDFPQSIEFAYKAGIPHYFLTEHNKLSKLTEQLTLKIASNLIKRGLEDKVISAKFITDMLKQLGIWTQDDEKQTQVNIQINNFDDDMKG